MPKDPNQNLNQNQPTPKPNDGGNDKSKDTFQISKDEWNKNQSNMQHLTNTVNNLSKKLEIAHKNGGQSNTNNTDKTTSPNSKDYVSRDEFNKLVTNYKKLGNSVKSKNHHADVLQHAKDALKMNNMKVSAETFNHLLGPDNRTTDANIDWYKPTYKKLHSHKLDLPKQQHHHDNKPTIGAAFAKQLSNKQGDGTRSLDEYLK